MNKLYAKSVYDLESDYRETSRKLADGIGVLDLAKWQPVFEGKMRPILPGELTVLAAVTSHGKTAVAQSISYALREHDQLFFELELPGSLMFERYLAMHHKVPSLQVEKTYMEGNCMGGHGALNNIHVCDESGVTLQQMEDLINEAEPEFVFVDYIGLIGGGSGSRYERITEIAQGLKVLAKRQDVPILALSQVARKPPGSSPEIFLHDCKDSGDIENSAGNLLGLWLDDNDRSIMSIKIIKQTKGKVGDTITLHFDAETMTISDQEPWDDGKMGWCEGADR